MPLLPRARAFLALFLLTASLPVAAFHDPGPPLLDQVRVTEDTYVAWRVLLPEDGQLGVESQLASSEAQMVSTGAWFLNGLANLQAAVVYTTWRDGATRLQVELPDPVGPVVRKIEGGGAVPLAGVASEADVAAGDYVLVAFASADGAMDAELNLFASPGAVVLGKTTGPAFLYREGDFEGFLNVVVDVPTRRGPVVVKAIEDVHRPLSVDGRLFMLYSGLSNSGDLAMGYDSPAGHRDLACVPVGTFCAASAFLHGGPSGAWQLTIDRNHDHYDRLGPCDLLNDQCVDPHVFATGADVIVP